MWQNIILFTTLEIVNVIVDVRATLSLKLNKTVPSDHSVLFSLYLWNMTVPNDRTILSIFNFEQFLENSMLEHFP